MSTRHHQLTIARHLRTYRAVAKNACHSGMITVLRDEDGDSLPVYLDAFAGEKTEDRVEITLDKRPLHEGEMRLLGFGERLPEEVQYSGIPCKLRCTR